MPIYEPPSRWPDWAEGSSSLVAAPTPSQQASGFTTGQRPTASTVNWLFRTLGRSIRWLSQGVNAVLVGAFQEPDFRLVGGGQWSWSANNSTLSWSESFAISMPGLADTANTAAAGSVVLSAGQVAYVTSNTPFSTTGDLTNGSATVANLAFESGVAPGLSVTGAGVPANTTVQSVSQSDSSITLSKPATATAARVQLTFATSGPLTVQAADVASFAPSANTVVVARCVCGTPNQVHVGVNASYMRVLDRETKALLGNGYISTMRATAGVPLAASQPVYLSPGQADNTTAGSAYPLDVSTSGTPVRAAFAGFCVSATAQGGVAEILMAGKLAGFAGLIPGQTYFASPTVQGGLQATKPAANGQFVVPVGAALTANTLAVAPNPSPQVQAVGSSTSFTGPVIAPRFINASGFKASYPMGTLGGLRSTSRRVFQLPFYDANGALAQRNGVFAPQGTGRVQAVNVYIDGFTNSSLTNYVITLFKNGTAYTFPLNDETVPTYVQSSDGSAFFSFVAGDVFSMAITSSGTLTSSQAFISAALQLSYD